MAVRTPRATGADAGGTIRIEGLDEFRKALRDMGGDLPKALGQAHKKAAQFVVDEARTRAENLGGVQAKVAPSLKAAAQQRQAVVSLGGERFPMALGAEFGALRYHQFPQWRGNQWQPDVDNGVGYFLHPAIRDTTDEFMDVYADAIDQLAKAAFPT